MREFRFIFFCWQSPPAIVFSLDFSRFVRAVIYRLGPDKSIVCPGQEAAIAAKAVICNTDYNSKGCQNYPRFLVKLSPVFVAPVHCLLWALVMTNWLDTTNLCYPLFPQQISIYSHTTFSLSGPQFPEFLLPFRKPKRIRTAFSPSQLLKLEHAFEKNQYVVGQERKELAKSLNLSETQVNTELLAINIVLRSNYNFLILPIAIFWALLKWLNNNEGQRCLIRQLIKFRFVILCI